MTTPVYPSYAGHRFPAEVISYAVWLYFRFPAQRSTDFVALLDQLGAAYGTTERARPLVAVLDNGPIHTSKLTTRALAPAYLAHRRVAAEIRPRTERPRITSGAGYRAMLARPQAASTRQPYLRQSRRSRTHHP